MKWKNISCSSLLNQINNFPTYFTALPPIPNMSISARYNVFLGSSFIRGTTKPLSYIIVHQGQLEPPPLTQAESAAVTWPSQDQYPDLRLRRLGAPIGGQQWAASANRRPAQWLMVDGCGGCAETLLGQGPGLSSDKYKHSTVLYQQPRYLVISQ